MRYAVDALTDDDFLNVMMAVDDEYNRNYVPDSEVDPTGPTKKVMDAVNSFGEYNRRLEQAGVPKEELAGLRQLDTGELQKGVVGPYIKNYDSGRQTRIFLGREDNPVTGAREVVPFLDPNDGTPLKYTFGQDIPDPGGRNPRADELTSQIAMKLAGLPTVTRGNSQAVEDRGISDLVVTSKSGNEFNVDVMMRPFYDRSGAPYNTVTIPAYTSLVPTGNISVRNYNDRIKSLVQSKMSQGYNLPDAVDSLVQDGLIKNQDQERMVGKILRNDIERVGSKRAQYDALIIPAFNNQEVDARLPDKRTLAPMEILTADLKLMRNELERGTLGNGRVNYYANGGGGTGGYPRVQAKVPVKLRELSREGGVRLLKDMTDSYPMVQQLLAESSMDYQRLPGEKVRRIRTPRR